MNLRVCALIPDLWDLQAACGLFLVRQAKPGLLELEVWALEQELGHHCRLRKLAQVEDHALALCDQVEVPREDFGVLHHGMVFPRDGRILQDVIYDKLLPSFNSHLHVWNQDVVFCYLHISLPHNEPLTSVPFLVLTLHLSMVEAAPHSEYRLLVLSHGQLLQVVICLEQHLTHARTCQPLGLEHFRLHGIAILRIYWVQREHRLMALFAAHLQADRQVLQIHRCCWVDCASQADRLLTIYNQTYHSLWHIATHQLRHCAIVAWHLLFCVPTNAIFLSDKVLSLLLLLEASLLGLFHLMHKNLRKALSVDRVPTSLVAEIAQRKVAVVAQARVLPLAGTGIESTFMPELCVLGLAST
mmetsp:Transcript_132662/g.234597  ORF Transcript_132662/g.234597 Transcript_132662/m.234597 type:complete len:357 (-) Transcript_132662:662-1732(-)